MSTRHNYGSHSEHHEQSAELHDTAAHDHSSAAEAHEKQDHETGHEKSRRSLEHSPEAFLHNAPAHRNTVNEHGIIMFGHKEIAALAYQLWQNRGCPEGSSEEDWFHAAQQLRGRTDAS